MTMYPRDSSRMRPQRYNEAIVAGPHGNRRMMIPSSAPEPRDVPSIVATSDYKNHPRGERYVRHPFDRHGERHPPLLPMYDDPAAMESYYKRQGVRYAMGPDSFRGRTALVAPRIKYRPSKSPDGDEEEGRRYEDNGPPPPLEHYPPAKGQPRGPPSPGKKSNEKASYDHALLLAEVSAIAHGEAGSDAPPTPGAGPAPVGRDTEPKEGAPIQRRRRMDDRTPAKHMREMENKRLCRSPEYEGGPAWANTRSPYPEHVSPMTMTRRPDRSPHGSKGYNQVTPDGPPPPAGNRPDPGFSLSARGRQEAYPQRVGREPFMDPRDEGEMFQVRRRLEVEPFRSAPMSRVPGGAGGPPPPPDFNRYPRGRPVPPGGPYRENEPPPEYYPPARNSQPANVQDFAPPPSKKASFEKPQRPRQFMNYDMSVTSPHPYGPDVGMLESRASPRAVPVDYAEEAYSHRRAEYYRSPGAGPSPPGGRFFSERRGSPPPQRYQQDPFRHQVPTTPVAYNTSPPMVPSSDPGRYYRGPPSPPRQQLRYAPPQSPPRIMYPEDSRQHPGAGRGAKQSEKIILRRKFSWKNYPELEAFLIANREEYLRHSALNYTIQQKQYNNRLTERLLEVAAENNYVFDEEVFSFVAVRDRIRCYYKSYVQSSKKRGIIVGYTKEKEGVLCPKAAIIERENAKKNACEKAEGETTQVPSEPSSSSQSTNEDSDSRSPKRSHERASSF